MTTRWTIEESRLASCESGSPPAIIRPPAALIPHCGLSAREGGGPALPPRAAAIAAQESQTHVQLEVEHAKIASQVYQLLSSDQKAKVADILAKHQQRMQEHMRNQGEPPDQQ